MIDSYSYRNIWKIAYPIILGSLAQDIITIVDTAFVGRLGEVSLGAVALGGIFYLSLVMLSLGFGVGVQVIIARRFGEGAYSEIGKVWQNSFVSLGVLAIILFGTFYIGFERLLSVFIQSNDIRLETEVFLNARLWGIFAAFANTSFRSFYIGIADTKVISYTTILMALINVFFDYVFIFGHLNFPVMGIKGAAVASVIAEYSAFIVFVAFTFLNPKFSRFEIAKTLNLNWNKIISIFKIALPTMIQTFVSFSAWFVFFLFVEKMGQRSLAISNIIRSIYIVFLLPIMGFSSATSSLVSYALGKAQFVSVKMIVKRSLMLSFMGVGFIVSFGLLFAAKIISVFTTNVSLIEQTLPVFYIVSGAAFFIAFGFIMFNAMTGTGNTLAALLIELISILFYLMGTYLLVKQNHCISQVWTLEIVYGLMLGIFSVLFFKFFNWKRKI